MPSEFRAVGNDVAVPSLLDRPMYEYTQAAHLLRVPASTLRWWLEGRAHHLPVLRERAQGNTVLTWGEFVEARHLAAYRRDFRVSLQHIRAFIDHLRQTTSTRYPLATERPWIGPGRRLLLSAQNDTKLEPELWSVFEPATGQVMLTPAGQSFLDVVEFDDDVNGDGDDDRIVRRLRPAGQLSPVVIDPRRRGGLASVSGISTSVIREAVDAGDPVDVVADDFGLDLDLTIAALDFERTLAVRAA